MFSDTNVAGLVGRPCRSEQLIGLELDNVVREIEFGFAPNVVQFGVGRRIKPQAIPGEPGRSDDRVDRIVFWRGGCGQRQECNVLVVAPFS